MRRLAVAAGLLLAAGCLVDTTYEGSKCSTDLDCAPTRFRCLDERCVAAQPVAIALEGAGTVRSGTQLCSMPSCALLLKEPSATLTAERAAGVKVRWGGDCAAFGRADACTLALDGGNRVTARFATFNYAFVTSQQVRVPDLGGAAGAERYCNDVALDAGVPGTFVALLSGGGANARERLEARNPRGWLGTDERPFADTSANLFDGGNLWYPLADERGRVAQGDVITGSFADGNPDIHCHDWSDAGPGDTMKVGAAGAGVGAWVAHNTVNCENAGALYCFGVDSAGSVSPPPPIPPGGKRVFLSSDWVPANGVLAANAVCASDALGVGGTYRALLSTADAGAAAVLAGVTGGFYRPDGVKVAETASELTAATGRYAPIEVTVDGGHRNRVVWTGGLATEASTSSCASWTGAGMGLSGQSAFTNHLAFTLSQSPCTSAQPVYCVQVQ